MMDRILIAANDPERLGSLEAEFAKRPETEVNRAASGLEALSLARKAPPDLVITDEELGDMSGLAFLRRLLRVNAMINAAVVSRLPEEEFHEAAEGLGVMARLPENPPPETVEELCRKLDAIKGLFSKAAPRD